MDFIQQHINTIINADCLDVMPDIPDKSIDMILCDLPYGITCNKWDSIIPLDKLWVQYLRIIKPNGAIVLTSATIFTAKLILSQEKYFKYKWVWQKSRTTNFMNAKKQPLRKHEDICVFYQKQPIYNPQMVPGKPYNRGLCFGESTNYGKVVVRNAINESGNRYPTDIIYFKTAETEGPQTHPTQKPVELGRYLIRTYTNSGDTVLDNACGSGSFLVAAALEGRKFIGIEKESKYVEIAENRIKIERPDCQELVNEQKQLQLGL